MFWASADQEGTLRATLTTPRQTPDLPSCEAVIQALKSFSGTWRPGRKDAGFLLPKRVSSGGFQPWVGRLSDALDGLGHGEVETHLHPQAPLCLLHDLQDRKAALYRRQGQGWRREQTFGSVEDLDLEEGVLRLQLAPAPGPRIRKLPWGPTRGDPSK